MSKVKSRRKKRTCKKCGEALVFRASFKHARTGKTIYAYQYNLRAFPFCGCKR